MHIEFYFVYLCYFVGVFEYVDRHMYVIFVLLVVACCVNLEKVKVNKN